MPVQDLILDLAIRYGFQVLGAFVILGVGFVATATAYDGIERRAQCRLASSRERELIEAKTANSGAQPPTA